MIRCNVCDKDILGRYRLTQHERLTIHLLKCLIQSFDINFEVIPGSPGRWRIEWDITESSIMKSCVEYDKHGTSPGLAPYTARLHFGAPKFHRASDMLNAVYKDLVIKHTILKRNV